MSHLPHILTPLNLHLGREKSGVTVRIFVANRGDIMRFAQGRSKKQSKEGPTNRKKPFGIVKLVKLQKDS